MEKLRLKQALDPVMVDSHRALIRTLETACAEVETVLEVRIGADPELARRRAILIPIPGIGPRIDGVLITDMPELGRIDHKAAASLAGMVVSRACPTFRDPYRTMREAGSPAKLAIVAAGRRVVVLANSLIREDATFAESTLMA